MKPAVSRRRFLAAGAIAASTIVDRQVLGAPFVPPSEKTTFAHIGMGTQGFRELGYLLADPRIQIVAVCDPNRDSNDYVDWGKHGIRNTIRGFLGKPDWREGVDGIPGGREVGRQAIDAYYARERSSESFRGCAAYADFRELLEREKDVDAVKVMTPDHLHAAISIAALKKGKHVVVHKPLANRLYEGRLVLETARKAKKNTYFLPYNSGESIRLIQSWIRDGAIGTLREIHNWSNRPVWPQGGDRPVGSDPVPENLDWEAWIGPAKMRPFKKDVYHTFKWRGFVDFGSGALGDMACHTTDGIYSIMKPGVVHQRK